MSGILFFIFASCHPLKVLNVLCVLTVVACLGFLSPANRGSLMTCVLVSHACSGTPAGFMSARMYKSKQFKQYFVVTGERKTHEKWLSLRYIYHLVLITKYVWNHLDCFVELHMKPVACYMYIVSSKRLRGGGGGRGGVLTCKRCNGEMPLKNIVLFYEKFLNLGPHVNVKILKHGRASWLSPT